MSLVGGFHCRQCAGQPAPQLSDRVLRCYGFKPPRAYRIQGLGCLDSVRGPRPKHVKGSGWGPGLFASEFGHWTLSGLNETYVQ